MTTERQNPDLVLFTVTCLLLVIGIVMVASASFVLGQQQGDPFFYLKRQALWATIGLGAMLVMMRIDYHLYYRWAFAGLILAYILLALVLLIGPAIGGSRRWLAFGSLRLQPSEFAKLAVINFLAVYFSVMTDRMQRFVPGVLVPPIHCGDRLWTHHAGTGHGYCNVALGTVMAMLFINGARILPSGIGEQRGHSGGILW